jgi:putative DNA primase/helicase
MQPIEGESVIEREPEEPRSPEFSDDALALAFAEHNKDQLRYVAKWSRWMRYDGMRWEEDDTLEIFSLARAECRESAQNCHNPKAAAAITSAKTVAAVVTLARSDRKLAATVDQWDVDPWLLNTPGGVVDLRTGEVRPHSITDYFTRITAVAPGGRCPLFREFLSRITGGDVDLQRFLARVFGYAATGSTREHALFFGYGTGSNGKSVLMSTMANVLADYAQTAPIETFTASAIERHPTELAALRGARLVTAIETEEGRSWAEARVKALTGGDRISARLMRQDFFEFTPVFKLVVAGNHKPGLRSVDEAIRRRFHLIPFAVTIPASERDPDLSEKFRAEWPGILQWIIEGCRDWYETGLAPPDAVTDATAKYLESEDALMAWVGERCMRDPDAWEKASELFADWKAWATKAGEPVGNQKRFSQNIEARGFSFRKKNTGNGYDGLQLVPLMTTDRG